MRRASQKKYHMKTALHPFVQSMCRTHARLFHEVALVVAASALTTSLPAQSDPPPESNATAAESSSAETRGRRANFNPAEMQARMLASLREQFAVKDDAEWSLISERITAVINLRRNTNVGGMGGLGNRPGGNNRPGATANPELDALRTAVTDNLPDAEIKARLERVREVRKQNEAKLTQAQEDLRAVLTVRQEALAVATGLLP